MNPTNKKRETFTFHGDSTVSVRDIFGNDLGTHLTNNDNPLSHQSIDLVKEGDHSGVFVGLGLDGGCYKCNKHDCINPHQCKYQIGILGMSMESMGSALDMIMAKASASDQAVEIGQEIDYSTNKVKQYVKIHPKAKCQIFNGKIPRGYSTDVKYSVEINASGKVNINFDLRFYSSVKKRFRLLTILKDANGDDVHSYATSDIELNNLEDRTEDYTFNMSVAKCNKVKSVEVKFRWAVKR